MIKLIVGIIGSGKTKKLINLVNEAANNSTGAVICIEKGDKLRYDISYRCRLINALEYKLSNVDEFYGSVTGIISSNSDITDIFIDSGLKFCNDSLNDFNIFIDKISSIIEDNNIKLTITLSINESDINDNLKKYI